MIAVIDNYDSFTYNLVQILGECGADIRVFRNDAVTPDELKTLEPDGIVISPGPGRPENAGCSEAVVTEFAGLCPILGVCLGHQAVNEAFGGRTVHAQILMHGKAGDIELEDSPLFKGLPEKIRGARYHSLAADREAFPECLRITARDHGEIMALEHKSLQVYGLQFHPESILTPDGRVILDNFVKITESAANNNFDRTTGTAGAA